MFLNQYFRGTYSDSYRLMMSDVGRSFARQAIRFPRSKVLRVSRENSWSERAYIYEQVRNGNICARDQARDQINIRITAYKES